MRTPASLGVVGMGARGRALLQAFDQLPSAEVRWIHDVSPAAALRAWRRVPYARVAGRLEDLLEDEQLDAVVVATPAAARGELAWRALEAGKHVLVDSPFALEASEADELVRLADRGGRRLIAGHALQFHPAARRLRKLVASGGLGELYYLRCERHWLDRRRDDDGVLWGAGAEAVASVLWLVGDEPVEAAAHGGPCGTADVAEVAACHLRFASGIEAEIRLSAVEPLDARRLAAVGSRAMAVLDELDDARPLAVHEIAPDAGGAPCRGDVVLPRLPADDPVRACCEHFLEAIAAPRDPPACGREGAAVVAVLDALQRSLERGGAREAIGAPGEPIAGVIRLPIRSA